jgi:methylase of polypeptide subunit release factors
MQQLSGLTARDLFTDLLERRRVPVADISDVPVEETEFYHPLVRELEFTHFNDIYDTLIYSRLIARALRLCPGATRVVDFGAGSSIPTLLALKETAREIETLAVDVDPEAISVGARNAHHLGLGDRYTFKLADMEGVLRSSTLKRGGDLIVSNPPYIAVPPAELGRHFVPIDGGPDGCRYLRELINQDYPSGTGLALLWGSLTCPQEILPIIEERYELLHLEAWRVHFGEYTSAAVVERYLERMNEEGQVYFERDADGQARQLVLGMVLRVP